MAVIVKVRNRDTIDDALKRFKREVGRSRVLQEYRRRMYFTKDSKERREAEKRSLRRVHRRRKERRS
jgi:small subunit ribosomal protein S21